MQKASPDSFSVHQKHYLFAHLLRWPSLWDDVDDIDGNDGDADQCLLMSQGTFREHPASSPSGLWPQRIWMSTKRVGFYKLNFIIKGGRHRRIRGKLPWLWLCPRLTCWHCDVMWQISVCKLQVTLGNGGAAPPATLYTARMEKLNKSIFIIIISC